VTGRSVVVVGVLVSVNLFVPHHLLCRDGSSPSAPPLFCHAATATASSPAAVDKVGFEATRFSDPAAPEAPASSSSRSQRRLGVEVNQRLVWTVLTNVTLLQRPHPPSSLARWESLGQKEVQDRLDGSFRWWLVVNEGTTLLPAPALSHQSQIYVEHPLRLRWTAMQPKQDDPKAQQSYLGTSMETLILPWKQDEEEEKEKGDRSTGFRKPVQVLVELWVQELAERDDCEAASACGDPGRPSRRPVFRTLLRRHATSTQQLVQEIPFVVEYRSSPRQPWNDDHNARVPPPSKTTASPSLSGQALEDTATSSFAASAVDDNGHGGSTATETERTDVAHPWILCGAVLLARAMQWLLTALGGFVVLLAASLAACQYLELRRGRQDGHAPVQVEEEQDDVSYDDDDHEQEYYEEDEEYHDEVQGDYDGDEEDCEEEDAFYDETQGSYDENEADYDGEGEDNEEKEDQEYSDYDEYEEHYDGEGEDNEEEEDSKEEEQNDYDEVEENHDVEEEVKEEEQDEYYVRGDDADGAEPIREANDTNRSDAVATSRKVNAVHSKNASFTKCTASSSQEIDQPEPSDLTQDGGDNGHHACTAEQTRACRSADDSTRASVASSNDLRPPVMQRRLSSGRKPNAGRSLIDGGTLTFLQEMEQWAHPNNRASRLPSMVVVPVSKPPAQLSPTPMFFEPGPVPLASRRRSAATLASEQDEPSRLSLSHTSLQRVERSTTLPPSHETLGNFLANANSDLGQQSNRRVLALDLNQMHQLSQPQLGDTKMPSTSTRLNLATFSSSPKGHGPDYSARNSRIGPSLSDAYVPNAIRPTGEENLMATREGNPMSATDERKIAGSRTSTKRPGVRYSNELVTDCTRGALDRQATDKSLEDRMKTSIEATNVPCPGNQDGHCATNHPVSRGPQFRSQPRDVIDMPLRSQQKDGWKACKAESRGSRTSSYSPGSNASSGDSRKRKREESEHPGRRNREILNPMASGDVKPPPPSTNRVPGMMLNEEAHHAPETCPPRLGHLGSKSKNEGTCPRRVEQPQCAFHESETFAIPGTASIAHSSRQDAARSGVKDALIVGTTIPKKTPCASSMNSDTDSSVGGPSPTTTGAIMKKSYRDVPGHSDPSEPTIVEVAFQAVVPHEALNGTGPKASDQRNSIQGTFSSLGAVGKLDSGASNASDLLRRLTVPSVELSAKHDVTKHKAPNSKIDDEQLHQTKSNSISGIKPTSETEYRACNDVTGGVTIGARSHCQKEGTVLADDSCSPASTLPPDSQASDDRPDLGRPRIDADAFSVGGISPSNLTSPQSPFGLLQLELSPALPELDLDPKGSASSSGARSCLPDDEDDSVQFVKTIAQVLPDVPMSSSLLSVATRANEESVFKRQGRSRRRVRPGSAGVRSPSFHRVASRFIRHPLTETFISQGQGAEPETSLDGDGALDQSSGKKRGNKGSRKGKASNSQTSSREKSGRGRSLLPWLSRGHHEDDDAGGRSMDRKPPATAASTTAPDGSGGGGSPPTPLSFAEQPLSLSSRLAATDPVGGSHAGVPWSTAKSGVAGKRGTRLFGRSQGAPLSKRSRSGEP
jgi:hypothetical protein